MTSFDIEPGGVKTVLATVSTHTTELETAVSDLDIDGAVSLLDGVPAAGIAGALAEFADLEKPAITGVFDRISACILGASNVTAVYGAASDEMLSEIQSRAIEAADSGDFSSFDTGQ